MATPPVERSPRGRGSGPRDYQEVFRNRLIESRLTPNAISLTGFFLCVVSAALILQGWWIAGGIAFIVGSVCDTLDGRYSRMSGKASPFGAFLDSTLDRVEEGVVLAAVAYQFSRDDDITFIASGDVAVIVVVVAVIASLMVSYTRARAEALGVECKVGIADRAVRVVVLSAGLVFGDLKAIEPAVYLLAAMAVITVFQRIFHVRSELTKPVTDAA
jgi:CDP-diacylglycerol---glycerol-3-phosphate 3-phosphatidyltransferase